MSLTTGLPIERLEEAYGLGQWREIEPLPLGKSQHWRFEAVPGRFVLRRSYRAKTTAGIRFEHELVAHLRAGGFPGPLYVPTLAAEPCLEADDRLWRVAEFVPGRAARIADVADSRVFGAMLARYHLMTDSFRASVPTPAGELIPEALRSRLDETVGLARSGLPEDNPVLDGLEATLARANEVCSRLEVLYPDLCRTVVHAGCRRGSTIFDANGHLAVVLDFDSARVEARALDLAIGVFDFAKLYGEPGSLGYKVHLDKTVADAFLDGYRSVTPVGHDEAEAVPLIILAKRLKRALGRYIRLLSGQEMSPGDRAKIALEEARVRSLEAGHDLVAGPVAAR
ncbi:MAG: phosphotransferase [Acidimicrobiia bacterium]